jgi:hypothetical protein
MHECSSFLHSPWFKSWKLSHVLCKLLSSPCVFTANRSASYCVGRVTGCEQMHAMQEIAQVTRHQLCQVPEGASTASMEMVADCPSLCGHTFPVWYRCARTTATFKPSPYCYFQALALKLVVQILLLWFKSFSSSSTLCSSRPIPVASIQVLQLQFISCSLSSNPAALIQFPHR